MHVPTIGRILISRGQTSPRQGSRSRIIGPYLSPTPADRSRIALNLRDETTARPSRSRMHGHPNSNSPNSSRSGTNARKRLRQTIVRKRDRITVRRSNSVHKRPKKRSVRTSRTRKTTARSEVRVDEGH